MYSYNLKSDSLSLFLSLSPSLPLSLLSSHPPSPSPSPSLSSSTVVATVAVWCLRRRRWMQMSWQLVRVSHRIPECCMETLLKNRER